MISTAMKKKMNMVIAQSGGPSMVINQSLVGAVLEARKSAAIGKILGAIPKYGEDASGALDKMIDALRGTVSR